MKEIKETKLVETTITKITYQSDDGNYNSEDKEAVELYEAHRKNNLRVVGSFYLPEDSNQYVIFSINSRYDLLIYKDANKDAHISFDGFREYEIPEKVKGYFVSHYEDRYDSKPFYSLTPIDRFIRELKESIEEDRKTLKQQEDAMDILNHICKVGGELPV